VTKRTVRYFSQALKKYKRMLDKHDEHLIREKWKVYYQIKRVKKQLDKTRDPKNWPAIKNKKKYRQLAIKLAELHDRYRRLNEKSKLIKSLIEKIEKAEQICSTFLKLPD